MLGASVYHRTNMFFTDPNTDSLRSQLWLAGTCRSRGEQRKVKISSCGWEEVDIVLVGRGFLPMPEQKRLQRHQVGEGMQHQ